MQNQDNEKLKEKRVVIGEGWILYPIQGVYSFNNGQFNITFDLVEKVISGFGKHYKKVTHLIPILNLTYREHLHLENNPELLKRDIESRKFVQDNLNKFFRKGRNEPRQ